MEDDTVGRRPKRQKRDSSYKAKAFEKLKQLKNGVKNKYEVGELENIYDTVDEREYTKKVLERQDDDWIVDDDGSGYVEDGRDIFDDDLDHESIAAAARSSQNKGVKRKKKVSANAGKGNLESLISNMPSKKKEEKTLDEDEVLAELLQEIKESPSQMGNTATPLKPKPVTSNVSPLSIKRAEMEYMSNLSSSIKRPSINIGKSRINRQSVYRNSPSTSKIIDDESFLKRIPEEGCLNEPEICNEPELRTVPRTRNESTHFPDIIEATNVTDSVDESCFNDDLDMSQIESLETPVESEDPTTSNIWDKLGTDVFKEWVSSDETEIIDTSIDLNNADIPLTDVGDQKVFRFFWWDAFEDVTKQPGVVFLFGKTFIEATKSYLSCCVAVRNIERRIFFLPRVTEKGSFKPVTSQDVYNEINNSVMKQMQIKNFKARPIAKKYAFDPQIPIESDYVEVRYSAKEPSISRTTEGITFSKVFGTETSYLEILLLDRKIKGPCWLNIANPTLVTNPISWCKIEVNCNKVADISVDKESTSKPPLIVSSINMRRTVNPKTGSNEIVMLSCITNVRYYVDKQVPNDNCFQKHFCVFTSPEHLVLPVDLHAKMQNFKATTLQKMHSEKALLNYFISQFALLDTDLIVGHDLQGYQINVLSERLAYHQTSNFSKLGRIKRSTISRQKPEKDLFVGRLVCDIKISAKELIKSRSYDLDSICQTVLKLNESQRIDLEPDEIIKLYNSSEDIFKLVGLTMQDTAYILKIMYNLNIIPLALQITNIAGNVMSRTLMGGRSERNEFLLMHAFTEKGYIVPDKYKEKKSGGNENKTRKKPTYSGGLVLDPKVGFYDKFILLMDFNSLYPSIIQEYNICFTTMPLELSEDNMVLPDTSLPPGILPTEIRKLVESRREVKKLMNNPDLSYDQRMQYHIRQMALKLTANSMYGCLGFTNSRFYAKSLAALVTYKGREILTNTKEIVERMNFEVIYGDTDSLMINTNIIDFDQVFQIGVKIKQEVNKKYRQVELDIDGVFKYLLLLKKKKYAAVILSKGKNGEIKSEVEYKGLDIVRRDWSRFACEAGRFILQEILNDQTADDRITNILEYLNKLRNDLETGKVPLSLLVITKQLTKSPNLYNDPSSQPHVQVALRYNKEFGGHFRAGDTIPYVICQDGTTNSATQRAYHIEELKNNKSLKIDISYYLAQQLHPVISRICEPIKELDSFQIAECLGVDTSNLKKPKHADNEISGENISKPEFKFRNVDKLVFICYSCKNENTADGHLSNNALVLQKCGNPACSVRPADYIGNLQNQIIKSINQYVEKYYSYEMYCEDPLCSCVTTIMPMNFSGRFPVCPLCKKAVLLKKYTEKDLYSQIAFFHYIFDLSKMPKKPILDYQLEKAYRDMKDVVEKRLESCGYARVNLQNVFYYFEAIKIGEEEEVNIEVENFSQNVEQQLDEDD